MTDSTSPPFTLYNTLTRKKEVVKTVEPGVLRFYSCGPTVYSFAHIGNFRTFLTADLVVRTAKAVGLDVQYVSNVTDVGHLTEDDTADADGQDKMARALQSKEGEAFANVWDLARHYTRSLLKDSHDLNLLEPDIRPRATQHMREQILAVQQLIETGHAYETESGVYFSVQSFPSYGKLSGNTNAEDLNESVRDVVRDPEKRDPRDFALWKKDEKHLMQWYSPWGWGFPGWHLECSVMANLYLGETLDVHAGGEDLIFPHHECEIAQAESLNNKPFANYWIHTRFLMVEGEKMSKSAGNWLTVHELLGPESEGGKGVHPLALRLALMSGHYRKQFNFTFDNLRDATIMVRRYQETKSQITEFLEAKNVEGKDFLGARLDTNYREVLAAMADDLNTPEALAKALAGAKMISGASKNLNTAVAESALGWLQRINALLGIVEFDNEVRKPVPEKQKDPLAETVEALLAERADARKSKDFARSDAIRDELTAMGIEVMDTPDGAKWRKLI